MRGVSPRDGQHPLGQVDAEHRAGTLFGQEPRQLARAAAEVEHAQTRRRRQQRQQVVVLDRPRPAFGEAFHARVASVEVRIVVDILRRHSPAQYAID